ncbi:hypothetical protein DFH05DRAFT_452163 [Lentinula detonsa]|uniref:Uncharacterized protein n=1 Tax=Lentinula detonsa TaxID=2804962 RepID=A0A9W8NSV0_9AGAR|nr:hypothetical protein DFH05DRAFT_452163 [Lentinula detonsa]
MIPRLRRVKRTRGVLVPSPAFPSSLSLYSCTSRIPIPSPHSYRQPPYVRNAHSGARYMSSSAQNIDFDAPVVDPSLGLGLRHANPPDTPPNTSRSHSSTPPDPGEDNSKPDLEELSDAEWEIRRTIDILRTSLPTFFHTGLMTSWDLETGEAYPSPSIPSLPHLPNLHFPHLPLPLHLSPDPRNKETESRTNGKGKERGDRESIYSSRIRLTYTPPSPLPHPFPEKLTLEGKPLYLASAVFIRHTLNTLYSNLHVSLIKVAVSVPRDRASSGPDSNSESTPRLPPNPESDTGLGGVGTPSSGEDLHTENSGYKREKSFYIALRVIGTSRVSGALGQWEVRSTYTFSPLNAQIVKHTVNGIEPAPERGVWEGLAKVLGLGNVGEGFVAGTHGQGALSSCEIVRQG